MPAVQLVSAHRSALQHRQLVSSQQAAADADRVTPAKHTTLSLGAALAHAGRPVPAVQLVSARRSALQHRELVSSLHMAAGGSSQAAARSGLVLLPGAINKTRTSSQLLASRQNPDQAPCLCSHLQRSVHIYGWTPTQLAKVVCAPQPGSALLSHAACMHNCSVS